MICGTLSIMSNYLILIIMKKFIEKIFFKDNVFNWGLFLKIFVVVMIVYMVYMLTTCILKLCQI